MYTLFAELRALCLAKAGIPDQARDLVAGFLWSAEVRQFPNRSLLQPQSDA
jgi:hypothetical protein